MRRKTVKIVSDLEDTQRTLPSDDNAGKVFIALGHGMRRCLICDGVFTHQALPGTWSKSVAHLPRLALRAGPL